jgi:hypothetical protein
VLGQPNFAITTSSSAATGLNRPAGLAFDGMGRVWVADSGNKRVVRFGAFNGTTTSITNGMAAGVVLGQADFTASIPCIFNPVTSLCDPVGVAFQNGAVYVTDGDGGTAFHNRVLRYSQPFTNGKAPDLVLGQPDFTTTGSGTTADRLFNPVGIFLDTAGNAWVADEQNHRVLRFTHPLSSGMAADLVLGANNFTIGNAGTAPNRLLQPRSVQLDGNGRVLLTEAANNRVLRFTPPFTNGMSADFVLGQADFTTGTANRGIGAPGRNRLNNPVGLVFRSGRLFVADFFNNRVLRFD